MSDYTKSTNFATKDNLSSGNPLKIVKGTEIDTEFNNIQTAIATKLDSSSGSISGATINSSTIGATTPSTGAFTTLSATGVTTLSNVVLPVIDNIKLGYTTTATAAGTTTLTSASTNQQFFTGSTTQTVVLPVTSTLALGLSYLIVNNSTGVVTVQSSGANTITLIPANASVRCTCILITGTTAASWSFAFEGSSNIPYKQIPTITATVATNILTLGLNPCSLDFRSSTASSGVTTTRNVTASISMTVSNGSTLGTSSGVLSRFAVLAIDNAGTVELAVVNANTYKILDERVLISTTAEGGTGTADSGTVIYSTTARTSVPFRIVGYVESTQATAGAYATSPSNIAGAGGSISAGTVIQVVNVQTGTVASTATRIPLDNTIPQNTEGAELFTVAITPTSATSKLYIFANVTFGADNANFPTIAIFQDTTANALTAVSTYQPTGATNLTLSSAYYMTAGTTSSTTFKLRFGPGGGSGTVYTSSAGDATGIYGGVCINSMTIMEIAA
jgi:hypothetical protein